MTVKAANGATSLCCSSKRRRCRRLTARRRRTFRLEFHGPLQPMLGQGTYLFLVGGQPHDIFIVPIGPIGDKMRYEALFF